MTNVFNTELQGQQEWSWLLAADLFLGGLGGGLFLLYQFLYLPPWCALLSIGLVIAGGVVLLMELGHPLRAWRAVLRPGTSWISRGVLSVAIFLVSSSFYIAPVFTNSRWVAWAGDLPGAIIIQWIAGLSACIVILYPGFVLAASRSIPFWNNPFISLLFFSQSLLGASAIVLLLSPLGLLENGVLPIPSFAEAMIIVNAVLLSIHLFVMCRLESSAGESVRRLSRGPLGRTFWAGVVGVGLLLPLSMVVWIPRAAPVSGALILTGGILFRYCMLKAGVYVPSALVGMDMSRLNRTETGLELEYQKMAARTPARMAAWSSGSGGPSPRK